ncbi:MAG: hypothetical protein H7290_05780 [Flavobacterium sp.]|nr:hypothetical protein [Aeromicrobium sp.]
MTALVRPTSISAAWQVIVRLWRCSLRKPAKSSSPSGAGPDPLMRVAFRG